MRDNVWRQIKEDLGQLHEDITLLPFHPFIEQIKFWASTEPPVYNDPGIFRALIELIQQMGKDVKQGKPVQAVLEQAASRSGAYNQPSWDVNNVYQAVFQIILNNWSDKIEPDRIRLPIVLLVMNAKEAHELISGAAFKGFPNELREDFDHLQHLLSLHGMTNWVLNYKQEIVAWQPFKDRSENIEQLINQVLLRIEGLQKHVVPEFIDIRTINEEENRDKLRKLRNEGCVVVLDVISMQHPTIQHQFRRSLLDVFPASIVARITPTDALQIEQRMIAIIEQHIEMEFYKRLNMDLDDKCQEISKPVEFARLLKNQVPKLFPADIKVQTGSKPYWFR